jgi:recombination protein RecR
MLSDSPSVQRLTEALRRLPGVGKRSAERYALHILSAPAEEAEELSRAVVEARERIFRCSVCCDLTEEEPCAVCASPRRDRSVVCVVEHPAGVMAVEKGGAYRGLYHVLHGALNPLDGVGPDELTMDKLVRRLESGEVTEVIVATNATAEGEATGLYIARQARGLGVAVSSIARGVPMGGALEYADDVTLAHALQGRTRL